MLIMKEEKIMNKFKVFTLTLFIFLILILSSCQTNNSKTTFIKEIDRLNENIYNEYDIKLLDPYIKNDDRFAEEGFLSSKPNSSHMAIPGHKISSAYNHIQKQKPVHGYGTPSVNLIEFTAFKKYNDVRITKLRLLGNSTFYGYKMGDGFEYGDNVLELYENHLKDRYSMREDGRIIVFEYNNIQIMVAHKDYKIGMISFSVGNVEGGIKGISCFDQMDTDEIRDKCFDIVDKGDVLLVIIPAYVEYNEIKTQSFIYPIFVPKNAYALDFNKDNNTLSFSDSTEICFYHEMKELYLDKQLTIKFEFNQPITEDTIIYGHSKTY